MMDSKSDGEAVVELNELSVHDSDLTKQTDTATAVDVEAQAEIEGKLQSLRVVPIATKFECFTWQFYACGASGVGAGTYTPLIYSLLALRAGHKPAHLGGGPCKSTDKCEVQLGAIKSIDVSASVQLGSAINCTIQGFFFTSLGPLADRNIWAKRIMLVTLLINWTVEYAFALVYRPSQYGWAFVLNTMSSVTFAYAGTLFQAAFPRLAANTPEIRQLREGFIKGEVPIEVLEDAEEKKRASLIVWGTTWSNIGYLGTLIVCLPGLLLWDPDKHPYSNNLTIIVSTTFYVMCSVWWTIFEKKRYGPPIAKHENILLVGWSASYNTFRHCLRLSQTLVCVLSTFTIVDGMNTMGTIESILQSNLVNFSFLESTWINIVQAIASILGCILYLWAQKRWQVSVKAMYQLTNLAIAFIPIYGCLGIFTNVVGFHHKWEIWAYQVYFGLFVSPWYAYTFAFLAETSPKGLENQIFALAAMTGRFASFGGAYISTAVIQSTEETRYSFFFCIAVLLIGLVMVQSIDLDLSKKEQSLFLAEEARRCRRELSVEEYQRLNAYLAKDSSTNSITLLGLIKQVLFIKRKTA